MSPWTGHENCSIGVADVVVHPRLSVEGDQHLHPLVHVVGGVPELAPHTSARGSVGSRPHDRVVLRLNAS